MTEFGNRADIFSASMNEDETRLSNLPDDYVAFVRDIFTAENPYAREKEPCQCQRAGWSKHARRNFILGRTFLLLEIGYGLSARRASLIIADASGTMRDAMRQPDTIRQLWGRRDKDAWEGRAISLAILGEMVQHDTAWRKLPLSERQAWVKKGAEF